MNILSELEENIDPLESIEVNALLQNSILFIRNSFKDRNVEIQLDSNGGKLKVYANQLLREVFDNILINGIKYNENHSVEFLIKTSLKKQEQGKFVKIDCRCSSNCSGKDFSNPCTVSSRFTILAF